MIFKVVFKHSIFEPIYVNSKNISCVAAYVKSNYKDSIKNRMFFTVFKFSKNKLDLSKIKNLIDLTEHNEKVEKPTLDWLKKIKT